MVGFHLVALFIATTGSAFTQDMSPPKEVKDLSWMVGTWTGSGKISFGGQETEIISTMTVDFDGQFLKLASVDDSHGFKMTKTVMIGWDAKKSQYISHSFTNLSPTARVAHGKIEGAKVVLISDPWEAGGRTAVARETLSKISDSKVGVMMEFKNGEKWDKGMDFVLSKK